MMFNLGDTPQRAGVGLGNAVESEPLVGGQIKVLPVLLLAGVALVLFLLGRGSFSGLSR